MKCLIPAEFYANIPDDCQIGDTYVIQATVCVTDKGAEQHEITPLGERERQFVLGQYRCSLLVTRAEARNQGVGT